MENEVTYSTEDLNDLIQHSLGKGGRTRLIAGIRDNYLEPEFDGVHRICSCKDVLNESEQAALNVLFVVKLEDLPLYINDRETDIVMWRLQNGK